MKTCLNCEGPLSKYGIKFCSRSCAASYNNRKYPKRSAGRRCGACDEPTGNKLYCSKVCHKQKRYEEYIEQWKLGKVSGGSTNAVSRHVRRYLRELRGDQCQECGWAGVNPVTGRVPLETHHIGDHNDHQESNLALLCPNCHSLTPTFRALNMGNGRSYRRSGLERHGGNA